MILGFDELYIGLFVAAGLSSVIGIEREFNGQPAGLRTHIILGLGAALASIISIAFSQDWSGTTFRSDPARIVAQVVSGIGFLGAGAILRYGINIKGLTTAGSLWTTAIIGIACGAGYYSLACLTTILCVSVLVLVGKFENWIFTDYETRKLKVCTADRPGIINELRELLESKKVKIVSMSASLEQRKILKLSMIIHVPHDLKMDSLINMVNEVARPDSMEVA